MFERNLAIETGMRRRWTVAVGVSAELMTIGLAALLPLIYTDKLPKFQLIDLHIAPPVSRPIAQAPVESKPRAEQTARQATRPARFFAPIRIPQHIDMRREPQMEPSSDPRLYIVGAMNSTGGVSGIPNWVAQDAAPRIAPPPASASSLSRQRRRYLNRSRSARAYRRRDLYVR